MIVYQTIHRTSMIVYQTIHYLYDGVNQTIHTIDGASDIIWLPRV